MTWAARYSRTEQPELTIWRDGVEVEHWHPDFARRLARHDPCPCGKPFPKNVSATFAFPHDPDLRADIAARVPVTECEEPGCVNWAMPDGRCHHLHGGSDEL